jgi:hypothetical protein
MFATPNPATFYLGATGTIVDYSIAAYGATAGPDFGSAGADRVVTFFLNGVALGSPVTLNAGTPSSSGAFPANSIAPGSQFYVGVYAANSDPAADVGIFGSVTLQLG